MFVDYPLGSRLRRSVLMATGDDAEGLARAAASEADVVMVELEDIVVPKNKDVARAGAAKALRELDWQGKERMVRVNAIHTEYGRADVRMVVEAGAEAVLLPKINGAADILSAVEVLQEFEEAAGRETPVDIWAMIESAKALQEVDRIADAHPRIRVLLFGGGDLGADLGFRRLQFGGDRTLGPVRLEYLYGYSRVITAARAAGIQAINMAYGDPDADGIRTDAEFSAQFGFDGSLAMLADVVPLINEVFTPTSEDLQWAHDLLNGDGPTGSYGRTARRFIAIDALARGDAS